MEQKAERIYEHEETNGLRNMALKTGLKCQILYM